MQPLTRTRIFHPSELDIANKKQSETRLTCICNLNNEFAAKQMRNKILLPIFTNFPRLWVEVGPKLRIF